MADPPFDEAASIASVQSGGLPLRAQQRIMESRRAGNAFFTSTLSPGEGLIARATGYEPIAQVMGSSIYHLGWGAAYQMAAGEAGGLTHAHYDARSRALSRMYQEASALGAHAVVGVKINARGYEWSGETIEFTAVGTAIRIRNAPPPAAAVLTLLDADQLWKAQLAGLWPAGIVMGNCCWYDPHADCVSEGNWLNQELPRHNWVSATVEQLAVERFRHNARQFDAAGIVGVKYERRGFDRHWGDHEAHTAFRLEILLLGTAMVRTQKPAQHPRVLTVLDLRDRAAGETTREELKID